MPYVKVYARGALLQELPLGARQRAGMFRLFKLLIYLMILGGIGLVGYAYLGDLSPERRDVTEQINLDAG